MARIKGVTESDANDDVRQIFAEQKKRHGFVSNAAQVSAVDRQFRRAFRRLPRVFRNQD